MSCKLPLFCFDLSCKHFRSSRSSFSCWRLNHFEFLKIITLGLDLEIILDSRISGVKFGSWSFCFTWFHHLYVALLICFRVILKLDCVSKIRRFFLNILFGFRLCSCVLIGREVKLLIKRWKCIVISFCYRLMSRLFLMQFISFQSVNIKSVWYSFTCRVWFWRNNVWRCCFCVSIRFSG